MTGENFQTRIEIHTQQHMGIRVRFSWGLFLVIARGNAGMAKGGASRVSRHEKTPVLMFRMLLIAESRQLTALSNNP